MNATVFGKKQGSTMLVKLPLPEGMRVAVSAIFWWETFAANALGGAQSSASRASARAAHLWPVHLCMRTLGGELDAKGHLDALTHVQAVLSDRGHLDS